MDEWEEKIDSSLQGSQNPGNKQSDNVKGGGSSRLGAQPRQWEVKEGFLEEVTLELRSEANTAGRAGDIC